MSADAIIVKNVWKKYRIYQDKPSTLKEKILYKSKGAFQEKWVLKDISLSIPRGRTVGLIGRNGSGKSTLLKVLTGILHPEKGSTKINGRVSSLLELGAGFHMDFTGRENIYMNASIFGLSRKEINMKLDEIIEFSELGVYIENPVRTYSSGMFMRLAFSIAISVNPDVLLIDEILAVGDSAFQRKCLNRIEQLKFEGKTIVIVSHDNGTIERLCDEVYWIQDSIVRDSGEPRRVIRDYLDFLNAEEEARMQQKDGELVTVSDEPVCDNENIQAVDEKKRWGNQSVQIDEVSILDNALNKAYLYKKGEPMNISFKYKMKQKVEKIVFGFGIYKSDGTLAYGTNTLLDKMKLSVDFSGEVKIHISYLNLVEGEYYIDIACHHEDGTPYDYITQVTRFQVASIEGDIGMAYLPHSWTIEEDKE
ncbi:ABC transporter ATP-binding protein [Paenibacillus dendritiformis]|uniref:ABC transporter ATP-binding protein n=1 Tax=Paenibacillus dendritiformis TaxID=130049 RepID=UPI001059DAB9|nr:ABC transporter ATP-binding protein [Paenibacillus dendritiformis]TDL51861.1 ABC transporter ATP-binding protein [Paenibacillus dendritiformis]